MVGYHQFNIESQSYSKRNPNHIKLTSKITLKKYTPFKPHLLQILIPSQFQDKPKVERKAEKNVSKTR